MQNRHKTRICAPIGMKFYTRKGPIIADFSTKFGRIPMKIHGDITDYSPKIRSKVSHAHKVNLLKESAENRYVDGVTVVAVPFCGLKGIQIKAIEI